MVSKKGNYFKGQNKDFLESPSKISSLKFSEHTEWKNVF